MTWSVALWLSTAQTFGGERPRSSVSAEADDSASGLRRPAGHKPATRFFPLGFRQALVSSESRGRSARSSA
jgi:hypothetical protein